MNEREDEWAVTAKRYVAYIDIMGFKDMVLRTPHEKIYEVMKSIQKSTKDNKELVCEFAKGKYVDIMTYSDSIMVYSKDESDESLFGLCLAVSKLTNDLLLKEIPHKGAAAFGMMTLDTDNSIFFGQPLIDAYLLQEELSFYGIIAHGSIEQEIIRANKTEHKVAFTGNYLCPFKNGKSVHLTICPLFVFSPEFDAGFEAVKKMRYRTSGHLRSYIDNTETYLNAIREGATRK